MLLMIFLFVTESTSLFNDLLTYLLNVSNTMIVNLYKYLYEFFF